MYADDGMVHFGSYGLSFGMIAVIIVTAVTVGIVAESIARAKGRSRLAWLVSCTLLPPLIAILLSRPSLRKRPAASSRQPHANS